MEATNVATAEDIQKAHNDVVEAERNQLQSEQSLQDAKQRVFEQQNKQLKSQSAELGQLGAQIDKDFGISKGLAGIAENITKFVANLAAAPLLGQLGAISAANPSQGGYGALGIAAARGAFGPDYTGIDYSQQGQFTSGYAAYGGGVVTPGTGGAPSEAMVKQIASQFGRGGAPQAAPFGADLGVGTFAAQGAPQAATRIGGVEPANGVGKGGVGIDGGGAIGMGLAAGGMALDAMAPGAGEAAQMGVKLINRTIEYGGQAVGIGAQGLIDTFLPTGGSELASNNWLTRIAGGLAGAGAAIPNMAGKSSAPGAEQKGPVSPEQAAANQQPSNQNINSGNTQNINVTSADKRSGAGLASDIAWHGNQANAAPGM